MMMASSLAFDRADEQSMFEVSKTLLVIYSIGSIAGPFTLMLLNPYLGDNSLMVTVSVACVILVFAAGLRRSTVAAPVDQTSASFVPKGSLEMAQAVASIAKEQKSAE
jgi:uncharacterized membrane protein